MGFLQICSGVILLQLSKSAKDVPDAAVFSGDLDQVRTVAEQEEPETEPKADAIRGAAAIIRRLSNSRQKVEAAEAKRIHEEKLKDLEPIGENEQVEWDGLRRRKTLVGAPGQPLQRRKTLHPPLGMTHFPDDEDGIDHWPNPNDTDVHGGFHGGLMQTIRKRAHGSLFRGQTASPGASSERSGTSRFTLIPLPAYKGNSAPVSTPSASHGLDAGHVFGLPRPLHQNNPAQPEMRAIPFQQPESTSPEALSQRNYLAPNPPPHGAKRQFSFQNVFSRNRADTSESSRSNRTASRIGLGSRQGSKEHPKNSSISIPATEEERLGLVKGDTDSHSTLPLPDYTSDDDYWHLEAKRKDSPKPPSGPSIIDEKELEASHTVRQTRPGGGGSPPPQIDQTHDINRDDGGENAHTPRNLKAWEGKGGGAFI